MRFNMILGLLGGKKFIDIYLSGQESGFEEGKGTRNWYVNWIRSILLRVDFISGETCSLSGKK